MPSYQVEFAIDVEASTPERACWEAWKLLSDDDALLPIGTVISEGGIQENIDLDELDYVPHDIECCVCGVALNNQCLDPDCGEAENHVSIEVCFECQQNASESGLIAD